MKNSFISFFRVPVYKDNTIVFSIIEMREEIYFVFDLHKKLCFGIVCINRIGHCARIFFFQRIKN